MNMVRGSGVDGLSGMQPSRVVGSPKGIYTIVRPVIDLSRHELRAYCEENNIPFCDDPSNDNEAYLRVKVRKLMAELDMNEDALVATARRMHRARGALEDAVDRFWTAHVTFEMGAMNEARFEVSVFVSEMEETQMRLIRRLVSFVGKEGHPPRELAVKGVVCSLAAGKAATLGGCLFKVKKGQVQVVREQRRR
jgi:tRNA(Ile)-lysidine synthase